MRNPSRIVALLAALVLCAPAMAYAQTSTLPDDAPGVSAQAPVPLDGGSSSEPAPSSEPDSQAGTGTTAAVELPDTGVDVLVVLLTGVMLTLLGVGLRLRTADAEYH